jgi:hypothetical protein
LRRWLWHDGKNILIYLARPNDLFFSIRRKSSFLDSIFTRQSQVLLAVTDHNNSIVETMRCDANDHDEFFFLLIVFYKWSVILFDVDGGDEKEDSKTGLSGGIGDWSYRTWFVGKLINLIQNNCVFIVDLLDSEIIGCWMTLKLREHQ